ncbi:MAG: sensor histidine kinase [Polaromonas sp.]|nr:sensor histidine kinase [Polaromonas sp.]
MDPHPASSLGARILWQMAVRIALVIGLVTLASYWQVYRSATSTGMVTLAEYVRERGERESQLFILAEDNLKALMTNFLAARASPATGLEDRAFAAAFERNTDGALRRRSGFAVHREPSAYIAARVQVNGEVRREMVTMLHVVQDFGRAWNNRFEASFLASLDGLAATYLPGVDWYQEAPSNLQFTDYPWVKNVLPENNPQRTLRWTGIWYDWVTKRFDVNCILPADLNGQFRYYAGISIRLNDIIERTRETGLTGTHNVIFRADGRLVSHPDEDVMAVLRKNKGEFSIPQSGDAHLRAIYQAVVQAQGVGVLTLEAYDEHLGVARIHGPDWYFVSVLPTNVLSRPAESTARMILWLGLAALLLELAIVGWIIRRQVAQPLAQLMQRLEAFGQGRSGTRMASDGSDELAQLGRSFNQMAQTIEEDQQQLREHAKSLEARVSQRTRQLQDKDRTKTRFLTAASHDLRQPIQAATLFIDSLKHSSLDERQRQTLAQLDLSVRSLRELLDGLLDISKLDAGAMRPERTRVGAHALLAKLGAEFASQALPKGLRLRVHYPRSDIALDTDPQLLMAILRNLLSNAVKYTRHGGILLGARRRAGQVALQVWDTGIGMQPDQLERIYEEFYQIDNAQRDRSKGFGIGLAIARRTTELLGCPLKCVSQPGRGTHFELLLPISQDEAT